MTGMREGELLGLKWSDVDWTKGQLYIQRQLQVKKVNGSVLVPPKTKAGVRHIKLGQGTLDRAPHIIYTYSRFYQNMKLSIF
jgi:integrase